jgi:hypothetical protein
MRVNWEAALKGVDEALTFFEAQGVKPTLRTLFYNLYSKALIPNTKSAYQYLSPNLSVSKWADQPQVCEVWVEKEALAPTLRNWLNSRGVSIRVNRGYSSWTFIYNNCESLKNLLREHESITVFYLGDLDPSGMDMERFLREALEYFELEPSKVKLERLAITNEQVEKHGLPPRPEDAETLAKLKRDPRMGSYGNNYIVELDALLAYVPEEFRRLVEDAVTSLWDEGIYRNLRGKADELREEAKNLLVEYKSKARTRFKEILEEQ